MKLCFISYIPYVSDVGVYTVDK